MTDEAPTLHAIQAELLTWAYHQIEDREAIARIAELLEAAGYALIAKVDAPAND